MSVNRGIREKALPYVMNCGLDFGDLVGPAKKG